METTQTEADILEAAGAVATVVQDGAGLLSGPVADRVTALEKVIADIHAFLTWAFPGHPNLPAPPVSADKTEG